MNPQSPSHISKSKLWHVHGKSYDLVPMLRSHPGGEDILIMSQGLPDCTPLFESYHAFADRARVENMMREYLVPEANTPKPMYTFEAGGFYKTVTQRVRAHFGARSANESVTSRVKATNVWVLRVSLQVSVLLVLWSFAFWVPPESRQTRLACAFFAGVCLISLGFNTMHDASHFALAKGKSRLNAVWLRLWTALALWSAPMWVLHHSVRHHAFTGNPDLDPDAQHARPFIRKNVEAPRQKYFASHGVSSRHVWAAVTGLTFLVLPGMFLGQIASYWLIWPSKGHLWKMSLPPSQAMRWEWWQPAVTMCVLGSFAWRLDWGVLWMYLLGCNVAYALCILPDHDTYESVVENHTASSQVIDWGEVQVRHSANFRGAYFTQFCGGINLQIEHHLFPSVNHVHLPAISPIVQQACLEFNVPYRSHANVCAALWSVAQAVQVCMEDGTRAPE